MVNAGQRQLESLVQFNIALLQYELACNIIFEKYNIDLEKILAEAR